MGSVPRNHAAIELALSPVLSFQDLGPDSVIPSKDLGLCRRLMGSGPASHRFGCDAALTSQAAFGATELVGRPFQAQS
jgi:hypothetical protein